MWTEYIGLGVGLFVLSLFLVLLFYGDVLWDMRRSSTSKVIPEGAGWRSKREHCPAACVLFKENMLDFGTWLMKLEVVWSPVTDTVGRHSLLAWGWENNHEFSKHTLYQGSGAEPVMCLRFAWPCFPSQPWFTSFSSKGILIFFHPFPKLCEWLRHSLKSVRAANCSVLWKLRPWI